MRPTLRNVVFRLHAPTASAAKHERIHCLACNVDRPFATIPLVASAFHCYSTWRGVGSGIPSKIGSILDRRHGPRRSIMDNKRKQAGSSTQQQKNREQIKNKKLDPEAAEEEDEEDFNAFLEQGKVYHKHAKDHFPDLLKFLEGIDHLDTPPQAQQEPQRQSATRRHTTTMVRDSLSLFSSITFHLQSWEFVANKCMGLGGRDGLGRVGKFGGAAEGTGGGWEWGEWGASAPQSILCSHQ